MACVVVCGCIFGCAGVCVCIVVVWCGVVDREEDICKDSENKTVIAKRVLPAN